MRVSIIGQAAFGEAVLARLNQVPGVEVCAISAPTPAEGARPDALWAAASNAGLPLIDTRGLKTDDGQARWKQAAADLCVMAFVTEILPDETFSAARLGTIQYHPSLLPLHRGSAAINWAIINGDEQTGVTIFWPDKGIDTGPILLQESCPIGPDDTVGSLYFDHLFPMGVDAIANSIAMVAGGNAPRVDQDHRLATYEPPCRDDHGRIDWHRPAATLYALIRGCNPQPGAWTTFEGGNLRLFDCQLTGEQEPGMPGRVLRIDDEGFDVRLNGRVIRVLRVQPSGETKLGAGEWARAAAIREGFRFR